MKTPKDSSPRTWQRLSLLTLCVVLTLIFCILLFATAYVHHLLGLISIGDSTQETLPHHIATNMTEPPDDSTQFTGPSVPDVTISTLPSVPHGEHKIEGIVNIMLIGDDRRPGEGRQRSDSMILCSFNTHRNSMTMISFLRDTYVAIPGYWNEKLNAAYQYGGYQTLDQTLAANFGVHVDANVIVDFAGFEGIVDLLGGVDIDLTAAEAEHLNTLPYRQWNLKPGMQTLTGEQALAYARIRKIDADAVRAQRQRKVITSLINKYRSKNLGEILTLTTQILETGFIQTDMTTQEILDYVSQLFPMLSTVSINNQQIPTYETYVEMSVGDLTYCKVPDLDANRAILQEIFKKD